LASAGLLDRFLSQVNPFKSHAHTEANICSNNATAQSYLSKALTLTSNLQANSTTNAVLQLEFAHFVSFLQNTTNQALISTNCTTFVTNLHAAQLADKAAENAREKIDHYIEEQFDQVIRNATGSNGPNQLDFEGDNDQGHRF